VARDAHDATWRALRRVVTRLIANVGTELTADAPAGLNVSAPAAAAYYVLPSAEAVARHPERNHVAQVYVFPSSERERRSRTTGPAGASIPSTIEITVAVRVTEELGADAYIETGWKTLTPKEREYLRCETLMGAVQDVMDSKLRGPTVAQDPAAVGDDIVHMDFLDARSGDERFKNSADEPGTWGSQRWRITQIITIPLQTS
jgi:hypothetical protein